MNIVFLDAATLDFGKVNMSPITRLGNYIAYKTTSPTQVKKRIKNADIIITNKVILNDSNLDAAQNLKLICVAATGYNNIDINAAKARNITVCNSKGYSTNAVADHTMMFLLSLSHRCLDHVRATAKNKWPRSKTFCMTDFPFSNLEDKTLGIIGYGAIGKAVAKKAKTFGMKVLIAKIPGRKHKTKINRTSLKTLLAKSDFVSLHCPLSPQTFHLINHNTLNLIKPTARLLNLARGPIVDETAIALALIENKIAGYATDVMEHEPPQKAHPFFDKTLKNKVLITPHIAWASTEARQNLINDIAENIQAFKRGKNRNQIT